jgi:hypothetical protein
MRMPQPVRKLKLGFGVYWSLPGKSTDCGLMRAVPDLEDLEIVFFRIDFETDGIEEEEWAGHEWARKGMEEWLLRGYEDGQVVVSKGRIRKSKDWRCDSVQICSKEEY